MAQIALTEQQMTWLNTIVENGDPTQVQSAIKDYDIPMVYATSIGQVLVAAELEEFASDASETTDIDFSSTCKKDKDLRCQVGHVLSNLKSRSKQWGLESPVGNAYLAFRKNAKATVLIVDKSRLKIGKPNEKGKIRIQGVEARHAVGLSKFARSEATHNLPLCKAYFYATELIPDTDIYGSGFFIAHDKVVTAAHVLNEAFAKKVKPENLLFIRGHYAYRKGESESEIELDENQLYLLDQPKILIRDQIRNGDLDGDMAWVSVRPYFKDKAYPFQWNGVETGPVTKGGQVYALGHGLGVPMKLSFGGKIQDETYGAPTMFTCDMNILPGSSGSPIFDANSHRLVGIVSGLHEIYTEAVPKRGCVELKINMEGDFSGVATHIAPFHSL